MKSHRGLAYGSETEYQPRTIFGPLPKSLDESARIVSRMSHPTANDVMSQEEVCAALSQLVEDLRERVATLEGRG